MPSEEAPRPPSAVGAIIMALGIFCLAALQRLPYGAALTRPAAALVCAVWLATAVALVRSLKREGIAIRTSPILDSFGIGTWVAGTAVATQVLMLALPAQPWLARGGFLLSAALWAWFFPRAVRNLARLVGTDLRPSGAILLTTVATQAVALAALHLFAASGAARAAAACLLALGAACYLIGAALVLRGAAGGGWRLAADWSDANCILHGALSITGLTAATSGLFDGDALFAFWCAVLALFVAVEAVECARIIVRVQEAGWRAGVFVYDLSQWARNFTFGMFYAFSLALAEQYSLAPAHPVFGVVLAVGAWVVLIFLLVEAALMLV